MLLDNKTGTPPETTETTDDFVVYLQGMGSAELVERDPQLVDDFSASVFDVISNSQLAELSASEDAPVGWTLPSSGRVWSSSTPIAACCW